MKGVCPPGVPSRKVCVPRESPMKGVCPPGVKGVCPPGVKLNEIYRGVVPFIILQLIGLALVFSFPSMVTWLPAWLMLIDISQSGVCKDVTHFVPICRLDVTNRGDSS